MSNKSKVSGLRMSTKVLLLNLTACGSLLLILLILLFSFFVQRNMLFNFSTKNIGKIFSNSKILLELSEISKEMEILASKFYGKNNILDAECAHLFKTIKTLEKSTDNPDIQEPISNLSSQLASFCSRCSVVNILIKGISTFETEIYNELNLLDRTNMNRFANLTRFKKGSDFITHLQAKVLGFRERFYEIGQIFRQQQSLYYFKETAQGNDKIITEIDNYLVSLETIPTGNKQIVEHKTKMIELVQKYKIEIDKFHQEMRLLNSRIISFNANRDVLKSKLKQSDHMVYGSAKQLDKSIENIFLSGVLIAVIVVIIVIVTLNLITLYLIKYNINTPMEKILKGISFFSKGDFHNKIAIDRTDEWAKIEKSLNFMADEILESNTSMRMDGERYRTLTENALEGIVIIQNVGQKTEIIYTNPTAEKILGYSNSELKQFKANQFKKLISANDFKLINQKIINVLDGKSGEEKKLYRLKNKNGEMRIVEAQGYLLKNAEILTIQISFIDMTTRLLTEKKLKASEKKYRDLYENAPGMYFSVDATTNFILDCTNATAQFLKFTKDEIVGQTIHNVYTAECVQRVKAIMSHVMIRKTKVTEADLQVLKKDKSTAAVSLTVSPEIDNKGKVLKIHSCWQDISKKIKEEKQLQLKHEKDLYNEKMIFLRSFISNVTSEIQIPNNFNMMNAPILNGIWESIVPILEKHYNDNGDFLVSRTSYSTMRYHIPKLFKGIAEGSEHIGKIVMQLNAYIQKDDNEMTENVNINNAVESAIELASDQIKASTNSITVVYAETPLNIIGNYQLIEQMIVNLIENACQALPDMDKSITVTTSHNSDEGQAIVSIEDEGNGITHEIMNQIRDPFFTTKKDFGSTGLGLPICDNIVNKHSGEMTIVSEPGKGTVVKLIFPVKSVV